jgi:hypothetical protein
VPWRFLNGLLVKHAGCPILPVKLVEHFAGYGIAAFDVWLGPVSSKLNEEDAYLANQLLARSVAWCLREKGQLDANAAQAVFAALDRQGKPSPLPGDLAYQTVPRPWGNSFVPKSCTPARRLQVVDVSRLKPKDRIALACLQGLTSRQQPCLWLNAGSNAPQFFNQHVNEDRFWLPRRARSGRSACLAGPDVLARFALRIPQMHSIFADMGRDLARSGIENLTYQLPSDMPVFRSVTSWRNGQEAFLREIREQVGAIRPAFVNAYVNCWIYHDLDLIAGVYDARDKDMIFVTPTQLATLYRQAQEPK